MNIISILYLTWLINSSYLDGFGGILFISYFAFTLYLLSFFHVFSVEDLKSKFIIVCGDMFALVLYFLYGGFVGSESYDIFIGIMFAYLIPVIIITLLSYGLTALWRKYRK